ncbi:MAG: exodeoxyribonuclease VII large subunit [bacterium]|nr:exodeoxyribonuclease VII large subunit [bacterium]
MDDKYITVSSLNRYIKAKFDIDSNLNEVFLKGEISNFKHHSRGHFYFTLKDEASRIAAVMFNFNASKITFEPENGMKVLVSGRISVYEATGGYQIYVNTMEVDGVGNLYLEYEKLKKELATEGLFSPEHKRPIPKYPRRIGIITAPTGAAIRDILSTIKRRFPICETILFPALVQGEGAKESVVKQLETAQNYDIDVIICGRGGGSIEDLWAFNEEIVARAIYNSKIPVISAVGHEIDFTIADFVADLRAPTPTGAAEMAVPNITDLNSMLNQYKLRATKAIKTQYNNYATRLDWLKNKQILKNPLNIYEIKEQKLDSLIDRVNLLIKNNLNQNDLRFRKIMDNKLIREPERLLERKQYQYNILLKTVTVLNPMRLLESGYSITRTKNGVITNIDKVNIDDILYVDLKNGTVNAKVISKENKNGESK